MLLLLTVIFLPDAPPVRTSFDVELAEKYGVPGEEGGSNMPRKKMFDDSEESDSESDGGVCGA